VTRPLRSSRPRGARPVAARASSREALAHLSDGGSQDAALLRLGRSPEPLTRRRFLRGQPRLAAILGQQPRVPVPGEDDTREQVANGLDHRSPAARIQRRHALAQERPGEGDVTRPVAGDQSQRRSHDLVPGLAQVAQVEIQVQLIVQGSERRDVGLHGHVPVERRLRERMIGDARQARLAGIRRVAPEPLREHVTDLQVLGLLGRPEGQEQLGVHPERPGLEAEADEQRRALRQPRIDTPRSAAPRPARRLARRRVVAGRVEAIPGDVGLGVPVQALGLAVQFAERGHLRHELEWEASLDEPLLLRLVRAQQPRRVIARLAHPDLRGRSHRRALRAAPGLPRDDTRGATPPAASPTPSLTPTAARRPCRCRGRPLGR
jgi:hypothetical protein